MDHFQNGQISELCIHFIQHLNHHTKLFGLVFEYGNICEHNNSYGIECTLTFMILFYVIL